MTVSDFRAKIIVAYRDSGEDFLQKMEMKGKVISSPLVSLVPNSSFSLLTINGARQLDHRGDRFSLSQEGVHPGLTGRLYL